MYQAWMEVFAARQFPAFGTTWPVSELLQHIFRDFHVPWHWAFFNRHEWWFIPTQYERGTSRNTSQNTRGGPRRALDRVQILQRRLFGHHLHCPRSDYKTVSPSCHNVFFGMETFSQPRSQVPPLSHDTSWNLPSNTENHRCSEGQEHSSILTSLQSLTNKFAITRHMTLVQIIRCMFNSPRKHRNTGE